MTNKTWKKEALEELASHSEDDFEKIGDLLVDGKLSDAAKIAVNSDARQYASSPAPYPITVGTDKHKYKIGENITFWLKNNWDRTIEVPASPYAILKDVGPTTDHHGHTFKWETIYEPSTIQVVHLKPGEKKEWIWNQKEANNTQVDEGDYEVVFSVEGWAEGTYSESFWIENENEMRKR